ncbi:MULTISPECIES: DUF1244 domain-containing protein [Kordiimonas]|jgi:hypothetical protein|uniref:SMc04008-like domain-containing protein n=1 Tax=Kordiimonas lacus TaxID=637679 RepID=A0A1G6ZVR9_9PROT|nr:MULTISPECIES: DUF1244 domain-containing protein [Kordiimonas]SDE06824.1 hypothetical protein SAMN04488071_1982 [Kordiimonas lacus]
MTDEKTTEIEAAVFRRLIQHFQERTDVQNIDLMGYSGFCRNCLYKWYAEEAGELGVEVSKEEAQERIYGMPYADYKEKYQTPATDEQLRRMEISVAKNKLAKAKD